MEASVLLKESPFHNGSVLKGSDFICAKNVKLSSSSVFKGGLK